MRSGLPFYDYNAQFQQERQESPLEALSKGYQIGLLAKQAKMEELKHLQEQQQQATLQSLGESLKAGNYGALSQIALINPTAADATLKALNYRDTMVSNMANQVQRSNVNEKPMRYQQMLQQLSNMGVDVSMYPREWSPDKGPETLQWIINQNRSNKDILEEEEARLKNQYIMSKAATEREHANLYRQQAITEPYKREAQLAKATQLKQQALIPKLSRADETTLNKAFERASSADQFSGDLNRLEELIDKVQFSPIVGEGRLNELKNWIYGTGKEADEFKALSISARTRILEKYKGSISDYEQKLAKEGTANLGQRPEAARNLITSAKAGNLSDQTKVSFLEAYANKYGNLRGANQKWIEYKKQYPILDKAKVINVLGSGAKTSEDQLIINEDNINKWEDFL